MYLENRVSKVRKVGVSWDQYVHKRIRYRHGADDHDIHEERYHDDLLIEANELVILGKAVVDKVILNSLQKIPVQRSVKDEIQALFDSVPILIDEMVPMALSVH
jgi:hypothetical protein